MEFRDLLLGLVMVWLAAKVAGETMERIGQTAVLGELLAGVLIGPGVRWVGRLQARGTLIVYSVVFAVGLAAVADRMGLATIIGAFAAGLILATTERRVHIEERVKPVADLLVPVFFVTVGMKVRPAMLNPFAEGSQLGLALLLTAAAIASKLAAGLAVYHPGVRRWPVAVGMVPRGEVGLIFAGVGLAAGVVAEDLCSALIVVVMLTTFAAPPWLKALYRNCPPE
jgi:Na+:H+ antiporter